MLVDGVDVLAVGVGEEAVGAVVEVVARGTGGASAAGGPCGAVEVADHAFVLGGVEGVALVALGAGFQVSARGFAVDVGEFQAFSIGVEVTAFSALDANVVDVIVGVAIVEKSLVD